MAELAALAERYRRFAALEAAGKTPLYEAFALQVAETEWLLAMLDALPPGKAQPNLLFAAVRHLFGTPPDAAALLDLADAHWPEIRALMLARSTQTNEPNRCAVLLPLLSALPQPLALIEVGAAAGLCLLPDRYGYDYGRLTLLPAATGPGTPIFPCRAEGGVPLPTALPQVVWRAGIDLNPLDLEDPEARAWLETLVWPGQEDRARRLRQAIAIARRDPPRLLRGDLTEALPALAAEAPKDATLVVFHSAVLAYLGEAARARFVETIGRLGATWIGNEAPAVLPEAAAAAGIEPDERRFLVSRDGVGKALADPHGGALSWLKAGR